MRNKNKFNIIFLSVYIIILILLSFMTKYIGNVNAVIAGIFSDSMDVINIVTGVLEYIEVVIFYTGLGIMVTICCIEYNDTFKQILTFSILYSLLLIIISLVIKSFFIKIDLYVTIATICSVGVGISIEILLKIKQSKKNNGDDDEE